MVGKIASRLMMLAFVTASSLFAQNASVTEESRVIRTYPFSHPDPVPVLIGRPGIYPYFSFRKYSHSGSDKEWRLVRLENDHVRVLVLPEAGGKVFGAVDKGTNNEFIYQNDVMKFRQVALRGPWTSGGTLI